MAVDVQRWLETDHAAVNHYQLLGRPLFDPRIDELLDAIRRASRELLLYQNHADPAIAKRAVKLQYELARAAAAFTDSAKLQAYHATLIEELRRHFLARHAGQNHLIEETALRNWLAQEKAVHPNCLDIVCRAISSNNLDEGLAELDRMIVAESPTIQQARLAERNALQSHASLEIPRRPRVFAKRPRSWSGQLPPKSADSSWAEDTGVRPRKVEVICRCGQPLTAASRFFGRTVPCLRCGAPVRVAFPSPQARSQEFRCNWSLVGLLDELLEEMRRAPQVCPSCQTRLPSDSGPCPSCGWSKVGGRLSAGQSQWTMFGPAAVKGGDDAARAVAQNVKQQLPNVTIVLGGLAGFFAGLAATVGTVAFADRQLVLTYASFFAAGLIFLLYTLSAVQMMLTREIMLIDVRGSWDARFIAGLLRGHWVDTDKGVMSCYSSVYGQLMARRCYWVAVTRCWGCAHIYGVIKESSYAELASETMREG